MLPPLVHTHTCSTAPSRHTNPFSTCWTRPGALRFRFPEDQGPSQLLSKLSNQGWWGAIVGPHGSGKTSLLESLKPALNAAGWHVQMISLHLGQRRLPPGRPPASDRVMVIVDGYEQLNPFQRFALRCRCRRARCGLLVTAHSPTALPTLITLAPDESLVQQLVGELASRATTPITSADVAASYACHGSNVRDIFFDLYDQHEQRRRPLT